MSIHPDRIQADLDAIARCTATPGAGATRPTMSAAWADARVYLTRQLDALGCAVRRDAAGNLHARPTGLAADAPAWLIGSHLDSVPHGGDFDGVVGVVLALELLRSAHEDGRSAPPIELIDFAEEEGPTFGLGMLGSRAWTGELSADQLGCLNNAAGQSYLDAGAPHGVVPDRLTQERIDPACYRGFIELHIEQGPGLWRRDQPLGVVRAIAGRRQFGVRLTGESNHAGATAMPDRRDALAGAAEMVLALESLAPELSPDAVLTVGRLDAQPSAVNVVNGEVAFTIDFRAPDDAVLVRGETDLRERLDAIAERRGLDLTLDRTETIPARPLNVPLVAALHDDAAALTPGDVPVLVSGALHDAAVLAPHLPVAMLFVPSRDGISHNPAEFSRLEDIAHAARIVERFVRRPTLDEANTWDRDAFVDRFGDAFEHSPWVAERTWAHRPFPTVDAMLDTLRQTLDSATPDERLALIRAHPDLVGALARTGQLTAASTAEQHRAGLDTVSADEGERFDGYNAAYREKFGFPFVICARENRKDAILAAMPGRLRNDPDAEVRAALDEILKIARHRINQRLSPPLTPPPREPTA